MIEFACQCGKGFEVDEQYAGRKIKCKRCGQQLRVPTPPEPPPEPPAKLLRKFGGAKQRRKLYYTIACLSSFVFIFPCLIVLAHWLKQDLTCDGCGFKTTAATLEGFLGFCPECKHYYFSGRVNWEKTNYVIPLFVVTISSSTKADQVFRGEEGWEIVLAWRKFNRS